jgi:YHS domain-containing protein
MRFATPTMISLVLLLSGSPLALAQPTRHAHPAPGSPVADAQPSKAVNDRCPISKEPIDGRTFTIEAGETVGFCCPGCTATFRDWTPERRATFIAAAKSGVAPTKQPAPGAPAAKTPAAKDSLPPLTALYPLASCPITGKPLGSMGDPVVRTYDGREVRFCCAACPPRFERDQEAQLKKLDAQIIAMQLPYYPLETCPVAGGALGSMGEPDNYVYQNRLVRFCCASCRGGFEKDPAKHIAALDKAAADQQRDQYPLDTCMVRGNRLGSMGDPAEVIIAGRLVRLCCPPCEKQLRENPAQYIATLDAAWQKAGRPGLPIAPAAPTAPAR